MRWLVLFLLFMFSVTCQQAVAQYSKAERFERYQFLIRSLRCDCDKQYLVARKYLLAIKKQQSEYSDSAVSFTFGDADWQARFTIRKDSPCAVQQILLYNAGRQIAVPKNEYEMLQADTTAIECYTDKKKKHFLFYLSGRSEGNAFAAKWVFSRKKFNTIIFLKNPPENAYQLLDGD